MGLDSYISFYKIISREKTIVDKNFAFPEIFLLKQNLSNSLLIWTAETFLQFYRPRRRRSINIIIVYDWFPLIKFNTNTPSESAVTPKSLQGRSNLSEGLFISR